MIWSPWVFQLCRVDIFSQRRTQEVLRGGKSAISASREESPLSGWGRKKGTTAMCLSMHSRSVSVCICFGAVLAKRVRQSTINTDRSGSQQCVIVSQSAEHPSSSSTVCVKRDAAQDIYFVSSNRGRQEVQKTHSPTDPRILRLGSECGFN